MPGRKRQLPEGAILGFGRCVRRLVANAETRRGFTRAARIATARPGQLPVPRPLKAHYASC